MTVDPVFAQWLQEKAMYALREDAGIAARWGETAIVSARDTSIALQADAEAEGLRQLAFMAGPLVEDEHVLPIIAGGWRQHMGRVITLTSDDLDYAGGVDVFLISARDDHAAGVSTLLVLRRL